jgi:2-polyprenyl-3-methyl-5-hydroxy-6-metoxy-1,4-benzoquinol methylase
VPAIKLKLEDAPCPFGCEQNDVHLFTTRDRINNLNGEFAVVRCATCDLVRISPRPDPASISAFYPDNYGPYLSTLVVDGAASASNSNSPFLKMSKWIFDTKAQTLPPMVAGKMLEIGCASGSFLHQMAAKGWTVEGIEYSPDASKTARSLGYMIETGAVESIEKADDTYDLIVAWMVVEHLHDPLPSLAKMVRWCKPEGRLVISVPNFGVLEAKVFGPRWYALHAPNHLYHFDTRTISALLDKAGWRVERVFHHRTITNLIASIGYVLEDKGYKRLSKLCIDLAERSGRVGAVLLFPFAWIWAALGQTGRITIWAKPK